MVQAGMILRVHNVSQKTYSPPNEIEVFLKVFCSAGPSSRSISNINGTPAYRSASSVLLWSLIPLIRKRKLLI